MWNKKRVPEADRIDDQLLPAMYYAMMTNFWSFLFCFRAEVGVGIWVFASNKPFGRSEACSRRQILELE